MPKCKGQDCVSNCSGSPFKTVKKDKIVHGKRLSASFYFKQECGGNIKRCKPQWILQPDGDFKLKEIRIVNGKHGPHASWVSVK